MACEYDNDVGYEFAKSKHRHDALRDATNTEGDRSAAEEMAQAYHRRHAAPARRREDGGAPPRPGV